MMNPETFAILQVVYLKYLFWQWNLTNILV